MLDWMETVKVKDCAVIELGAGTSISTIRRFSQRHQRLGMPLIRINPREAQGPEGTISIGLGAKEALQKIDSALQAL